jgi:low affinity Fe/Cu permease
MAGTALVYAIGILMVFFPIVLYRVLVWLIFGKPITGYSLGLALAISVCVAVPYLYLAGLRSSRHGPPDSN